MASLPHHPTSQRRLSHREPGSSSDATVPPADHETFSTTSVDSDTILFNSARQPLSQEASTPQAQAASAAPRQPAADNEELRRCWICFNDENEDGPGSSAWRSPCPCALVAHEDCLLDWVASQEAPNARRQAGSGSKITCPQCKNEIHLKRPRSLVVEGVRAIEKFTGYFVLPGTVGVLGYTVFQACFMHGVGTVYAVFGVRDGIRILQPLYQSPFWNGRGHESVALTAMSRFFQHARLHFGLATIPPILIASRLSIADSILPILPVIFLASSGPEDFLDFRTGSWPPSASLCFSLLPYIRAAYNKYMERVWGKKQRQWLKEMQPRAGETDDAQAADDERDDDALRDQDDAILALDLDVRIDLGDEDDADEHFHDDFHILPGEPVDPNAAHPFDAPPLADNNPAAQAAAQAQAQVPGHDAPQQQRQQPNGHPRPRARPARERNLIWQGTNLADTVLGALVFPSIAAAVGELLRLGLPKSWTAPPATIFSRPTGFLQQRWARSLMGGCLFVVVKDAVMLYMRWRMAQSHRRRKVLDYDKKKGRVVEV
ncbi:hypothetical protein IWZ03DRAFT_378395 [Phyllosticta citriasiana]|uniref:RING-CH-type domain-containing protein n=1 Tax=Phyllosticta citriasiana TaxID=595635 RepID=A0ABR1KQB3_9PEZI